MDNTKSVHTGARRIRQSALKIKKSKFNIILYSISKRINEITKPIRYLFIFFICDKESKIVFPIEIYSREIKNVKQGSPKNNAYCS